MQDVGWERIDKTKFFLQGVGLFSGVTTVLFPLTVIKTRQMTSRQKESGFQGTKAVIQSVWRSEGVPGFYRGFATIIFGTIPARMIYLTTLEAVKDQTSQLGEQFGLPVTALAGMSNFFGGAAASLSTQLVTVPIDVIAQRQIVHGTDVHGPRPPAPPAPGQANPAHPPGSKAPAPASPPGRGQTSNYSTHAHANQQQWQHSNSNLASSQRLHNPPQAGQTGQTGHAHTHASQRPHRYFQGSVVRAAGTLQPHGVEGLKPASAPSSLSAPPVHLPASQSAAHPSALSRLHGNTPNSWAPPGHLAPHSTAAPLAVTHASAQHLPGSGVHASPHSQAPASSQHPHPTMPAARGGVSKGWAGLSPGSPLISRSHTTTASSGEGGAGGGNGTGRPAATSQRLGGIAVARLILKEEGVRGLYRGFGISVITFVPSSAMWWSAYGMYREVVSQVYLQARGRSVSSAASLHLSGQTGAAGAATGLPAEVSPTLTSGEAMGLQMLAAMMAGGTSSLLTNPLDLIKTRIQVARKAEGQAVNVRGVLAEILREDGYTGLLRGVAPRMLSSALWGSAMVTVYEHLKRISIKDEP